MSLDKKHLDIKPASTFSVNEHGVCVLSSVVASFPHLAQANSFDGTDEKLRYSINGLLPVDEPAYVEMKKHFASSMPKGYKPVVDKLPFGEPKKNHDSWVEKYGVSSFKVKAVNKKQPRCFDTKGVEISPDSIIGGDIVNMAFSPYWFENKFGHFLQLQLNAVMLVGGHLKFASDDVDSSVFGVPMAASADSFSNYARRKQTGDLNPNVDEDEFNDDIPFG